MSSPDYDLLLSSVESGSYSLEMLATAADRFWALGKITTEERADILAKAVAAAPPNLPADDERISVLEMKVATLERKVAELEATKSGDGGSSETPAEPADEWPEFVQPTGAHDIYHTGDKVTFEGARYVSLIDNNSWSPGDYPQGWERQATPAPEEAAGRAAEG